MFFNLKLHHGIARLLMYINCTGTPIHSPSWHFIQVNIWGGSVSSAELLGQSVALLDVLK
jgi:hypothetical protein